jgi:hypothetical protein
MGLDAYLFSGGMEIAYFRKDHATRDFIVNSFLDGDFDAAYGAKIPLNVTRIKTIINFYYIEVILNLLNLGAPDDVIFLATKYAGRLALWIKALGYARKGLEVYYTANW